MAAIRRITKRDRPQALAKSAASHEALLREALSIAQRKAARAPMIVREILASATVEGLAERIDAKAAAITFRVPQYKRTWHSLIPWQHLSGALPAEYAEVILGTVRHNLYLTENDLWPKSPRGKATRKRKA